MATAGTTDVPTETTPPAFVALALEGVTVRFGGIIALEDVSMSVVGR